MISCSSLLVALVLYSVVLAGVCQLRWHTRFLQKHGVSILLLVTALATVRLFLPFEISVTHAVRSWAVLGSVQTFLHAHPAIVKSLLAVWFIGAVVAMGVNIFAICRPHWEFRGYICVEDKLVEQVVQQYGIKCPVRVSPDVDTPSVVGVLRHTIYLPTGMNTAQHVELALAHELQHIRGHDALIKVFFGCLWAVLWWNPVMWLFQREINSMLELRCDAKVTEHMDKLEQVYYMDAIVELSKRALAHRRMFATSLDRFLVLTPPKSVDQRYKVLHDRRGEPPRRVKPWVYVLLAVLFFMSYLVVFQPASVPPADVFQDDFRTSYEDNYDGPEFGDGTFNTFIVKGLDGRYQLFVNYEFSKYLSSNDVFSNTYQGLHIFEEVECE